jgi:hypothetical protein
VASSKISLGGRGRNHLITPGSGEGGIGVVAPLMVEGGKGRGKRRTQRPQNVVEPGGRAEPCIKDVAGLSGSASVLNLDGPGEAFDFYTVRQSGWGL